jgi:hypothetical protein
VDAFALDIPNRAVGRTAGREDGGHASAAAVLRIFSADGSTDSTLM